MQKSNLKLINPNFFYKPTNKKVNRSINDLINLFISRSHLSKEEKIKFKFIKDKFKEILALTIEWSYEEVYKKYV